MHYRKFCPNSTRKSEYWKNLATMINPIMSCYLMRKRSGRKKKVFNVVKVSVVSRSDAKNLFVFEWIVLLQTCSTFFLIFVLEITITFNDENCIRKRKTWAIKSEAKSIEHRKKYVQYETLWTTANKQDRILECIRYSRKSKHCFDQTQATSEYYWKA